MQVPELRFKEFNDEWQLKKLNEIANIYDGTHQTPKYTKSGVPFVSVEDIKNIYGTTKFISKDDFQKNFKIKPQKNDILMTRIGDVGTPAIVKNDNDIAFYVSLSLIKFVKQYIYIYIYIYIYQYIFTPYFKKELHNKILHVAFPKKINLTDIGKCKVFLPSSKEQTKIADFLSLIDRKIELQEKLVENLKLYKKGLLKKVFSNNLGWKSAKLGDFLISSDKTPVEDTSKYKKLTVKLNLQGLEENIIKRTMLDTRPFYIRHQGEIIIGKQNYFNGSIAIVSEKFDNYICSNAIMSFSISNANTYFIYYQISQSDYINKRSYMANGTGQKELSEKDFLNFDIKIPSIEEQNRIANLFTSLDKKIELETKKLQDLKTYKKGLLQKMFI